MAGLWFGVCNGLLLALAWPSIGLAPALTAHGSYVSWHSGKRAIRPSLFYHTLGREMKGLGQGPWTGKTCNDQRVPRRVGMAPPLSKASVFLMARSLKALVWHFRLIKNHY